MGKQNLVTIMMALFAGIIGGVLSNRIFETRSPQNPPQKLLVSSLSLVNNSGRVLSTLEINRTGNSSLVFFDQEGSVIMELGASLDRTAFLNIKDSRGNDNLILTGGGDTPALLGFSDNEGKKRMVLALTEKAESPGLALISERDDEHSIVTPSGMLIQRKGRVVWHAP